MDFKTFIQTFWMLKFKTTTIKVWIQDNINLISQLSSARDC